MSGRIAQDVGVVEEISMDMPVNHRRIWSSTPGGGIPGELSDFFFFNRVRRQTHEANLCTCSAE